jgi:hypothetical protein
MMDQNSASWNRVTNWLRQVAMLMQAAQICRRTGRAAGCHGRRIQHGRANDPPAANV